MRPCREECGRIGRWDVLFRSDYTKDSDYVCRSDFCYHGTMAGFYSDPVCPVACALDKIGEKWTLLILRDLTLHPSRRFQDLIESLRGCAPNTLSARLSSLEELGLIERRQYEQHPPRMEYVLTDKGREVRPVLKALKAWGLKLQAEAA